MCCCIYAQNECHCTWRSEHACCVTMACYKMASPLRSNNLPEGKSLSRFSKNTFWAGELGHFEATGINEVFARVG